MATLVEFMATFTGFMATLVEFMATFTGFMATFLCTHKKLDELSSFFIIDIKET
ncbi:hypothetical protein [Gracilibacillus boraciitolerans]|uniref:hypothetical protein n=1 Tax=Gracilibacillus boraciitolerans TaxID=307521 RepID=UPI001F3C9AB2|nr:hypothetical protein [Gracilibacillus boraciitolerans]